MKKYLYLSEKDTGFEKIGKTNRKKRKKMKRKKKTKRANVVRCPKPAYSKNVIQSDFRTEWHIETYLP